MSFMCLLEGKDSSRSGEALLVQATSTLSLYQKFSQLTELSLQCSLKNKFPINWSTLSDASRTIPFRHNRV